MQPLTLISQPLKMATRLLLLSVIFSPTTFAQEAKANPISTYIINGKAIAPWVMTLGDEDGWYVPLKDGTGESKSGKIEVEKTKYKTKDDAIQITWTGKSGPGSFTLSGHEIDLSSVENQVALVLDMRVDSKIRGGIAIGMDCDYPCRGSFALKPIAEAYPKKEWFTLPLPLTCFSKTGADLSKIKGPVHLQSEGRAKISIANARLVVLPEGSPNICAGSAK